MAALAFGARIVLALTFLWSAFAKLRTWRALPGELRAFGVPASFVGVGAVLLPLVEIAVAVLLVAWPAAAAGWIAAAVLVIFTAFLVRAAANGVPCPCFGVVDDAPSGAAGIVRNGVLIAIAALATGDAAGARAVGVVIATVALGALVVGVVAFSGGSGRAGARPR
jgi:hypothetical protein